MIWILFYYNSLPDAPEGCRLFSNAVMHRDFFKCNPTNTGHYQYPKFETLSYDEGCHRREVNNFLNKNESEKYVAFYTRYTTLSGEGKNKIIGYFKVGEKFEKPNRGFLASESILLPKDKCIEINYNSRGVPVSWGNSSVRNDVDRILSMLITKPTTDITDKYKKETKMIMDRLLTVSGRKEIIDTCEKCEVKAQCYWGRKTKRFKEYTLKKLYGGNRVCWTTS